MRGLSKFQIERGIHCVRDSSDIKKFLLIVPDIISEAEEEAIMRFVQPKLQRKRYEGNHWDSVISKYKETEMSTKNMPEEVSSAIERISALIRHSTQTNRMVMMPPHVLDLSADGFIGRQQLLLQDQMQRNEGNIQLHHAHHLFIHMLSLS